MSEGDLIRRSALKAELEAYRHTRNYKSDEDEAQNYLLDNILEDIDNAPTVEPQDRWGKWVISEIRCPNCLEYFDTGCYSKGELDKCPSCGAKLKGGAE